MENYLMEECGAKKGRDLKGDMEKLDRNMVINPQKPVKSCGLEAFVFKFKYFLLWFVGFFGFFAMNTHCPCCGQNVCPASAGVLALVSGIFALFMQFGRKVLKYIKRIFLQIWKVLCS